MSQYDTSRAAIRFEQTGVTDTSPGSTVERCSISHSSSWALSINKAKNIAFKDNIIYETHRNAIKVEGVIDFTMTGNLILKNNRRHWDPLLMLKDQQFAVDLCSAEAKSNCTNIKVQDNIIAGGEGGCWLIPAGDCNNESTTEEYFKNNAVHSCETGIIPHIDQQLGAGQCGMVKNTLVHHNYEIGVFSKSAFSKLLLKDSTFIENGNSTFHLQLHNGAQTTGEIIVENSLVIGEHEASRDCTDKYELSIKNKTAIYSSIGIESVNSAAFQYPTKGWHKVEHDSIRGNTCTFTKVIFKDFPGSGTKCIATRPVLLFQIHPQASDLIMEHIFSNIALNNVNADTLLYLMDPPEEWVDPTDCVGFVCTGPQNVLLSFKEHVNQTGTTSIKFPPKPFDIISDNPGFNTALSSSCNLVPSWNANNCTGDDMALLQFESLDPDRLDRSVQPVYVSQGENNLKIKLNSFMDHIWDGFYTGQKKLLRFPALVKVNTDNFHIIKYEGTPPLNQLFELYGTEAASDALKLRLLYSNPDYV